MLHMKWIYLCEVRLSPITTFQLRATICNKSALHVFLRVYLLSMCLAPEWVCRSISCNLLGIDMFRLMHASWYSQSEIWYQYQKFDISQYDHSKSVTVQPWIYVGNMTSLPHVISYTYIHCISQFKIDRISGSVSDKARHSWLHAKWPV